LCNASSVGRWCHATRPSRSADLLYPLITGFENFPRSKVLISPAEGKSSITVFHVPSIESMCEKWIKKSFIKK
jgi:hypothetical protein